MAIPPILHIWTMRTDRLDEVTAARWLSILDETERQQAARFAFSRNRVEFIAAHALLRAVLSRLHGAVPTAWQFYSAPLGKPSACLTDEPTQVSFNLSHTDGIVGVSACLGGGWAIGFDLEPATRNVDLTIADHFFSPQEVLWLNSLAESARVEGFLRIWTLKKAFIKATGKGLSVDLTAFSFNVFPPRIRFSVCLPEREADWWFEQRLLDGDFLAAVSLRRVASGPVETRWKAVDLADLRSTGLHG